MNPRLLLKRALLVLVMSLLLGACASLPQIARTESHASTGWADTSLGRIVSGAERDHGNGALSGFRLLSSAPLAFDARIAVANAAQHSIDIQYYLLQDDDIGRGVLAALVKAAQRGVHVRILLDDLYTARENDLLMGAASFPNVEIRFFNPFAGGRRYQATRFLSAIGNIARLDRRMHNKLFIADNAVAITGGRNLASEYFMLNKASNFVDLDVLCSGPVVRELSHSFDDYWNSSYAYPIASLQPDPVDPVRARDDFARAVDHQDEAIRLPPAEDEGERPVSQNIDAGKLDLVFAPARAFADPPEKIEGVPAEELEGTVAQRVIAQMQAARSEVVVTSPYFIPGERGMAAIRAARARGVRLVVITNSLAGTDQAVVHGGYARYRPEMVRLGVELFELSPTLPLRHNKLGRFGTSMAALHVKSAVIDRSEVYIGSMNLDGRSAYENTEVGLLIYSPTLAQQMLKLLDDDHSESVYRVRFGPDGESLQWVETDDDGKEVVFDSEPEATWFMKFKRWLLAPLTPEKLM